MNQISDISYSIDTDNLSSDLVDEKISVVTNPIPTTEDVLVKQSEK